MKTSYLATIYVCAALLFYSNSFAQTWLPAGNGMNVNGGNSVSALAEFNGELYAGGAFDSADGTHAAKIAKWDGAAWLPVDSGMNSFVLALTVYNNDLYAGGFFNTAGGISANYIAKWDGTSWDSLGSGVS